MKLRRPTSNCHQNGMSDLTRGYSIWKSWEFTEVYYRDHSTIRTQSSI